MRDRPRHATQFGIESTLNTLDGETNLTLDLGHGPVVVKVPNADVNVREQRIEAFASQTWRPAGNWSTEARLSTELSGLNFHGDVMRSARLLYVKPSIHLARTFASRNQLYGRIARNVGQLDFMDFVTAASLADGQITGGNPDLRPESSWRGEIGADLRFGAEAALGMTAFHDWFNDVVDWVPWGDAGAQIDAPGNLGRAAATGFNLTIRSPVPRIAGLAVTAAAMVQQSAVTDPITSVERIAFRTRAGAPDCRSPTEPFVSAMALGRRLCLSIGTPDVPAGGNRPPAGQPVPRRLPGNQAGARP